MLLKIRLSCRTLLNHLNSHIIGAEFVKRGWDKFKKSLRNNNTIMLSMKEYILEWLRFRWCWRCMLPEPGRRLHSGLFWHVSTERANTADRFPGNPAHCHGGERVESAGACLAVQERGQGDPPRGQFNNIFFPSTFYKPLLKAEHFKIYFRSLMHGLNHILS